MRFSTPLVAGLAVVSPAVAAPSPSYGDKELFKTVKPIKQIELGPRPYYLVNDMDEGSLKKKLQSCSEKPQKPSQWSIAHRGGGTLQFPEHSLESNLAGARMGAGILECDVAFTKDRQLVCRHSQCDLHYTTNIVTIPELNKKCTQPFKPAKDGKPASAKCCTSDITLKEFKTLCAKMEGFNATATNAADFLHGTPPWRTDLYATCGTVLSNKEHIQLTKRLGLKHTPELKTPEVKMPFDGDYTQKKYAQQLIDEHKQAGVKPSDVYLQSFLYDDILYWLKAEPEYARQAMYLDETGDTPETFEKAVANLTRYKEDGVRYIAPPLPYLVTPGKNGKIVPSAYAKKANELGLKIITWTLERSGPLKNGADGNYYYTTIAKLINNDGDVFNLLDVFREIGVAGAPRDTMDNNASPSPDPDATTRRRSGRVVRAPTKFTPDTATQSTNPKRKRDDQDDEEEDEEEDAEIEAPDSDEEMSNEPDNDSDEDHPAPRSRKKSSQTSRAKKPSAKKPKINGSKPLRPARVTHAAKSLPSRPKKSVRIEDAAVKGHGLYSHLFGSGDSSKSVAEEWLASYKTNAVAATADLVNCILQCAGCDQLITEDDVLDLDNVAGRLADLQSIYQEQQITDYPLISRTKHSRSFRDVLISFFECLIVDMHQGRLMYRDETFLDNLHTWLASMSSSSLRPFRHTATTISLAVQSALVTVANDLDYRLKKSTEKRDKEQTNKDRKACADAIQSFFDTVFVHRYRDVDPKIRTECVEALGNWIISLPVIFLEPGYLRYLGWMLSDTNAPTRLEVLKQLTKVFRRDAGQLGHFIDRFRPRLVEMACKDSDVAVRVAAIGVIDVLRDQDLLEGEEVDAIGKLIFDNELRIRKAVVGFFVACTKDAISEKTKDLRDSEATEDIPRGKKASVDAPRMEWIDLKCLAETLAIYDNQIEEEHQSGQILGLDVAVDLLESAVPETRISLAAQVLFEKVNAIKQWTLLAGYLLFDHTTSSKSRSKGNNPDLAFKKAVAPTTEEESILLDVLSSAVKSSLTHAPDHDRSRKKPQTGKEAEDVRISPEDTAAELVIVIPPLLSKFGAEPDTAAIVLRLAHFLDLEIFKQLRQNTNRYEKLLDEIVTQFNRHDDKRVLSEATAALLHSRQYGELEEITDSKLSYLWETVITSLHNFDKTYELSSRGNLGEAPLRELSTVLLKISKLASISDCIDVLEADGDSSESTTNPAIQILANIVHRGKYEPLDDQDIDDLEDEVVSFAIKTCQFYFMWKTLAYSRLLSTTGSIADAELDRLSALRQTFRRHLIETLSSRAAIDQLRLFATGSLCDLHLTFATLRPTIDQLRPSSSSESQSSNGEKYKTMIQDIESGLIPELIAIFDGTEKQYAKKIKKDKTLNEPAEDEDPMADDEDEEDEDEDEGLSEEERFTAELKAEKALCELTAKYVLVITARLVDHKGSHGGKLRRRLLRNQNKLGNNFKEVVTYLDEEKLAERTRKKAAHAQAPTSAKPQKAQLSEAIVIGDDDEDDIFDDTPPPEEGSREDLRAKGLLEDDPIEDDDENEDEEAERPAHESDDDVIGD